MLTHACVNIKRDTPAKYFMRTISQIWEQKKNRKTHTQICV